MSSLVQIAPVLPSSFTSLQDKDITCELTWLCIEFLLWCRRAMIGERGDWESYSIPQRLLVLVFLGTFWALSETWICTLTVKFWMFAWEFALERTSQKNRESPTLMSYRALNLRYCCTSLSLIERWVVCVTDIHVQKFFRIPVAPQLTVKEINAIPTEV